MNSKVNDKRTPLSLAVMKGCEMVVGLLLLAGDRVDMSSKDNDGRTLLLLATMKRHKVVVECFSFVGNRLFAQLPTFAHDNYSIRFP